MCLDPRRVKKYSKAVLASDLIDELMCNETLNSGQLVTSIVIQFHGLDPIADLHCSSIHLQVAVVTFCVYCLDLKTSQ